ncbi:MAG: hypothetical protein LQ349_009150 [Xanthoria aureola]|nr:MAG: hypothetical protein LQ349_009150 [Xanthoria aureola]
MGREDRVVKVNGIPADPSEPECHLRQLGSIFTSCVVDWIQDDQIKVQIAAFVEVEKVGSLRHHPRMPRSSSRIGRLTRLCADELLPPRNIPTLFVPISRIPYTNSDKINLKLLKDELQFVYRGDEYDNASGRQVYEHPILENLGAHPIPARQEPQIIASHTRHVRGAPAAPLVPDYVRMQIAQRYHIPPDDIEDLYQASPFEEGLAAIALEDPGSALEHNAGLYSATITYALARDVNVTRLHPALASVVSWNPIDRITLVYSLEGTMQVVHRNLLVLNGDLSYFRWRIDEYIRCLVLSIYHTLYDVWTIVYLLEDVNYNYNHPSYNRPGRALYRRFIEHTSKLDQSVASSYWSNLLQNVPISQYPPLKLYYQARVSYSVEYQIYLDTARMRDSRVTVATVMAAALALIISA